MLYLACSIRPQSNSRLSKSLREIRFSYLGLKTCPAASLSASLIYLVMCPAACAPRSSTSCGCPYLSRAALPALLLLWRGHLPSSSTSSECHFPSPFVCCIRVSHSLAATNRTAPTNFCALSLELNSIQKASRQKKSIQKVDTICTNQLITVSQKKTNKISSPIHLGSACLHYFSGYQRKLNFRTGSCMFATSSAAAVLQFFGEPFFLESL